MTREPDPTAEPLRRYLEDVPAVARPLVQELDALVRAADPRLIASLKWGNLTYHRTKNVCAIVTHARHVNLQLWAGAELADPHGLLEGTGRQMRHLKLWPGAAYDRQAVAELVKSASQAGGE